MEHNRPGDTLTASRGLQNLWLFCEPTWNSVRRTLVRGTGMVNITGSDVSSESMKQSVKEAAEGVATLNRRRGAIKQAKIHHIKQHEFITTFFKQFTFCSVCREFVWWASLSDCSIAEEWSSKVPHFYHYYWMVDGGPNIFICLSSV